MPPLAQLSRIWAGILLCLGIVVSACGGGSSSVILPDDPDGVVCPAIVRASLNVTVQDATGSPASAELLQLDRLINTFQETGPALFVQCGDPSPAATNTGPILQLDSCENMALGVEQPGSFTLTPLLTLTAPITVTVPEDDCGVITQEVTLVQGDPNLAQCNGSTFLGCQGISIPFGGTDSCNPTLAFAEPLLIGDAFCGMSDSPVCDLCEIR